MPEASVKPAGPRLAVRQLQSPHAGPVSFELAAGECLAIVGASGSGKSVLLRMLADLIPCSGEVHLDGTTRSRWPAPHWRARVVWQAAEPAWWEPTVEAHFTTAQRRHAQSLLAPLILKPDALQSEISQLSTGERQRLALIRSLACAPQVLLLDEPSASLDTESITAMEILLRARLEAGMSIIIVTHSDQQAARLGDRTLRMTAGRLASA